MTTMLLLQLVHPCSTCLQGILCRLQLCWLVAASCPSFCCSVGLYLRPLGTDLWSSRAGTASELSLMFLLLGAGGTLTRAGHQGSACESRGVFL